MVTPAVLISGRTADAADREVPCNRESDLVIVWTCPAIGKLVACTTRFMLLRPPRMAGYGTGIPVKNGPPLAGLDAEAVRTANKRTITALPE